MLEVLKISSKIGDRFIVISDPPDNEECVLFEGGNRPLSQKYSEQVYVPGGAGGASAPKITYSIPTT